MWVLITPCAYCFAFRLFTIVFIFKKCCFTSKPTQDKKKIVRTFKKWEKWSLKKCLEKHLLRFTRWQLNYRDSGSPLTWRWLKDGEILGVNIKSACSVHPFLLQSACSHCWRRGTTKSGQGSPAQSSLTEIEKLRIYNVKWWPNNREHLSALIQLIYVAGKH